MIATSFAWPVLEYIFFFFKRIAHPAMVLTTHHFVVLGTGKKIQIHITLLEFHRGREFKSPLLSLLYTTNVGMGYPI